MKLRQKGRWVQRVGTTEGIGGECCEESDMRRRGSEKMEGETGGMGVRVMKRVGRRVGGVKEKNENVRYKGRKESKVRGCFGEKFRVGAEGPNGPTKSFLMGACHSLSELTFCIFCVLLHKTKCTILILHFQDFKKLVYLLNSHLCKPLFTSDFALHKKSK